MTMTLVSTVTVGSGGAASIDFTSIPQTGTDLLLVLSGRGTPYAGTSQNVNLLINNGATGSCDYRFLSGSGSAASSSADTGFSALPISNAITGPSATSNTFGNVSIYIPNYTSGVAKSISCDIVTENNATAARQVILAGKWSGTVAITQLSLSTADTFVQYSTASLYTITKGSGGASVA